MSRSRVLVFTFMALFILAAVVDSATIVRRSIPEVFNSPFHVLGKRNQFYGLFKKLNYDSVKPAFLHDGFGWHH
ncbi:hypothetical protein RB195_016802 [Necator americanus]|uniref:Uncharacterized protein n=1 Tax=Necator americanus TaxID=51031 RepID=A0ABR1C285_NECAM